MANEPAEARFEQALSVARNQNAKSWELRAATSLARLWQPKYKDAYDLQDAKSLLDDLKGGAMMETHPDDAGCFEIGRQAPMLLK